MLAAGSSRRFNGIKQLAMVEHQPMLKRAIDQLALNGQLLPELASFTLILGANVERIEPIIPQFVRAVHFAKWQAGMGASLAFAVDQMSSDVTHLLVTLADQVDVSRDLLRGIIRHCQHDPDLIIAAKYAGICGPPVIFPRRFFGHLAKLEGDRGARTILKNHCQQVKTIDMPQGLSDIDTYDDLQRWLQR